VPVGSAQVGRSPSGFATTDLNLILRVEHDFSGIEGRSFCGVQSL
jgi:hypothetical protein